MRNREFLAAGKLLTVGWVARRLHLSEDRIRQLAKTGALPCRRAENGTRIFDEAEVQRFAEQRAQRRAQVNGAA
jgi:DNA-binding transcriptional MerR regulator